MKRLNRIAAALLILLVRVFLFSSAARGADVVSTLTGSGDWNIDTQWDSALFPDNGNGGFTYDAVVNSFTVTIPALVDIEIESLSFNGGTISGEGSLTLNGASSWDSGTLSGGVTGLALDGTGVLTIGTATAKLFNGQVSSAGMLVWTAGLVLPSMANSTFTNTGTIDLQGDGVSFDTSSTGSVVNAIGGTLSRTVGTGTATIDLPLTNLGTVDVDTGTLKLTRAGGSSSGAFDIASGAVLEIASNFSFETGASSTGPGALRITSGKSTVAGNTSLSSLQLAGGTIGGGEGVLSINGASSWDSGTLSGSGAGLALDGTGVLTIGTATGKLFNGQVSSAGILVWTAGLVLPSMANSTFTNTGTIDLQGDGVSFDTSSTGSVVNAIGGTLSRTVGTGTATIDLPLTNQGTVDVDTGTLKLTRAGGSSSDTFDIASGAVLEIASSFSFETGANSIGDGKLQITSGTSTVAGNTSLSNLQLSGGTIGGGEGVLSINGASSWDSGTLSGGVTGLALDGTGVLTIGTATAKLFNGQVSSAGMLVWTAGLVLPSMANSTFTNTGTIDLQGDGVSFDTSSTGSVVNAIGGTLSRTVGTGTATIDLPLTNLGTVDVDTGTLKLTRAGGSSSGAFDIASGAVLEIASNFSFETGASSTGAGTLRITGGTSTVAGNTTLSNFQLAGGTLGGEGSITLNAASSWDSGTLTGSGTGLALDGSGVLTIGTATAKLFNGQVSSAGTIVWTEGSIRSVTTGSTFSNTGTIDLQGDGVSFDQFNTGSVVNAGGGILSRTVGIGTAAIDLPVTNNGTIDVDTGTLRLTNAGGSSSGAFDIASGAVLEIAANFTFDSGASSTGAGDLRITGGTSTVAGNTTLSNFQLAGGTLGGEGSITLNAASSWDSGTLTGSGTGLALDGSGVLTIGTATAKLFNGQVSSAGTIVWTEGSIRSVTTGSTFSNTGTIDLQGDGVSFDQFNTGSVVNAGGGILSRTVGIGTATIDLPVTNNGTIDVDTGTLRLTRALSNYDATAKTLSGGAYRVAGKFQFNNADIETNQADITLDGPASQIVNPSNVDALADFSVNDTGASFAILSNRDLTTTADFVNRSTLQLGGGTFDALSLTNEGAGEIFGFGTITPQVANGGTVRAVGGTLVVAGGIAGNSGTVQIDAGAVLDLSSAGGDSSADLLIHNGDGLNLGGNDFIVSVDYTNGNFGSGNAFDHRANVSGAGEIRAVGDVTQELTGDISGGDTLTPTLAFGNVHVGVPVTRNYRIANTGATGPSLRGAIQTLVSGGNLTDSRLDGSGVTAANFGPILTGADSGDLAVMFDADSTGPLTGQAVRITNNFDNVSTQLLTITGTAWQLAIPSAHSPEPVDLGIVHVGEVAGQAISLTNLAASDGFSEGLNAQFAGTTGGATAAGSFALLAPGATDNTSLVVGLDTSSAGAKSGTATIGLESDGTGSSGLGLTPLTSQTVNISAQVNNFADALIGQLAGDGILQQHSATSYTLDLGTVVRGQGMLAAELGVTNDVPAPADELAGDFTLDAADFGLTGFGPFADLGAGLTRTGLDVEFASASAGVFDGQIALSPRSENVQGFSGDLPQIDILLSARAVYEADFNEDGQVDSQDLALWQGGFGTLADATHGQGDADADADVDGADFLTWQRQLGSSIPAVSASTGVPEPAAWIMLMLGMAVVFTRRQIVMSKPKR